MQNRKVKKETTMEAEMKNTMNQATQCCQLYSPIMHTYTPRKSERTRTLQGLQAQSELVWFSCLLLKPEQSGIKGPMCVLGRGRSWM